MPINLEPGTSVDSLAGKLERFAGSGIDEAFVEFSAMRAVLLCPVVCHLVALETGVLRCPRTYGGRASLLLGRSVRTVGVSTDGYGRAASGAVWLDALG